MATPRSPGIVYLVGAGPGDPGLLTVRGRALLDDCDAVVFDALANPALLPVADARGRPSLHDVGKRGGSAESARQEEINELLVRLAREGKRVVRLKGGDPLVFGRGSEEAQALSAAGIAFEIVPGVTAGIAAPAYAGIPVTHRGVATSVTFVTGHEDPTQAEGRTDWAALAHAGGTIVLYMGVKTLPRIASALIAGGMRADTPAAAVQWGTYPRQRTVVATLDTLASRASEAGVTAPVITVIGPVVSLRRDIAWLEQRPLHGARIVVTRAQGKGGTLAELLQSLGADVIEAPATRIEKGDLAALRAAAERLSDYGWIVFTSQVAVELFWDALRALGRDARALAGVRVCAIGPATADTLGALGIVPDVTPERFVAEGLLDALAAQPDVRGARVLHVAAEGARDTLRDGLARLGAHVDTVHAYRSVPDPDGARVARDALAAGEVDVVVYASAGAVRAFTGAVGSVASRAPAACIGPVTAAAARDAGLRVEVESAESTLPALAQSIASAWQRRRPLHGEARSASLPVTDRQAGATE
jgi:uroporphyrinogen III methyltransferase/synthase